VGGFAARMDIQLVRRVVTTFQKFVGETIATCRDIIQAKCIERLNGRRLHIYTE
jgi:hypothetical protein